MTPGPDTKAIVSYLPDADWLPDWMRVEQLVEMFREFYADFDPAKANEMLARLELEPKARLKTLSKGSKEKVQLILAMSRAAKLYLLDEHWRRGPCRPGLHPEHHPEQLQPGCDRHSFHPPHRRYRAILDEASF